MTDDRAGHQHSITRNFMKSYYRSILKLHNGNCDQTEDIIFHRTSFTVK